VSTCRHQRGVQLQRSPCRIRGSADKLRLSRSVVAAAAAGRFPGAARQRGRVPPRPCQSNAAPLAHRPNALETTVAMFSHEHRGAAPHVFPRSTGSSCTPVRPLPSCPWNRRGTARAPPARPSWCAQHASRFRSAVRPPPGVGAARTFEASLPFPPTGRGTRFEAGGEWRFEADPGVPPATAWPGSTGIRAAPRSASARRRNRSAAILVGEGRRRQPLASPGS